MKKAYLCNGLDPSLSCKQHPLGCYLNGGDCRHTFDERYAKNKENGFNEFENTGEYLVEKEE